MKVYHFGLIGYPVKHSLSPFIHKHFLENTGLRGEYSIIEINPADHFQQSIQNIKEMHLDGFNITVPYKQSIIEHLDEIDPSAKKIGAVNTVLCKDGLLYGYNTDGLGYVRSLESQFPELLKNKDTPVLILGAGGAAKGIYHGLLSNGYHNLTVANRTLEKAEDIAGVSRAITMEHAEQTLAAFKVVIQTTTVGMKPDVDHTVISPQNMMQGAIASDIVYQPILTQFLKEAKARETFIHKGHTMLLYQAQSAFEIWTGKLPQTIGLDAALQKELEG